MVEIPAGQEKKYAHVRQWICTRIREIREARGLTQAQLAEKMNCHFTRVSDFEANRSDYKASTVYRAAAAMNVSMQEVFRGCPDWKQKDGTPILIVEPEKLIEKLVAQGYDPKDVKKTVAELVAGI